MKIPAPHAVTGGGTFGAMSGENPRFPAQVEATHENLTRTLRQMGLKFDETHGRYGDPERSVLIYGPRLDQMKTLGKLFGQESVIHSQGGNHQLHYTNGPDEGSVRGTVPGSQAHDWFEQAPEDYYTHIPGNGYFRINFDFDQPPANQNQESAANNNTEVLGKSLKELHNRVRQTQMAQIGIFPHPHAYEWHDAHTDHHNPRPWEQAVAPTLIKNDQAAGAGIDTYAKYAAPYGQVKPGTMSNLFHYDYRGKLPAVQDLVKRHGYQVYYAGGKYGKPDLANKNYNTGHLMIYDPTPASGGDFGDEGYTNAWRQVHELAHALTYPELNNVYGEGRRIGKLGHHRTLNEAMRAVHWEHLAAHKQRELSKHLGIHVSDEDFNKEYNTVMHDAIHRAVTGKFTEPSQEGFVPHSHPVPLATALDMVRGAGKDLGLAGQHDLIKKPMAPKIQTVSAPQPAPNHNENK